MNSSSNFTASANFYRFAAACSAFYVLAQLFQEITFHYGINDGASGEQAILQRLAPLDQFRLTVILLSFSPSQLHSVRWLCAGRKCGLQLRSWGLRFHFCL